MSELGPKIRSIVAATFGVPVAQITDQTSSDTIESWDSMNHLHLVVALEAEFGVSFEPERAVEMTSLRAIEQALVALGAR
jgi:acyl carrier protein